jgi:galactokinase
MTLPNANDRKVCDKLLQLATENGLDVEGGRVRRTSSRMCLGVEHGDYNGTELFGVGTDRFIWLAFKPNGAKKVRLLSNDPDQGDQKLVTFSLGETPPPHTPALKNKWARFPLGVDHILHQNGYRLTQGFDGILWSNIPGGGMSRSASLTLNLILTFFEASNIPEPEPDDLNSKLKIIDLAQAVENDYIGSPCGNLDQIMIYFAKEANGTHYSPRGRRIKHYPLGSEAPDFRFVSLDTGTKRPGLEKSTYRIRRAECEVLVNMVNRAFPEFGIQLLGDVRCDRLFIRIHDRFNDLDSFARVQDRFVSHADLFRRLKYIFYAQQRFDQMLEAWKRGDIKTVGKLFRDDGRGLRDDYQISGPELETMCDIVRTVPGVYGERMLGGGDKGACGALVAAESVDAVKHAVSLSYPLSRPELAGEYQVHDCRIVNGVTVFDLPSSET